MAELIIWGFSIYIAVNILCIAVRELFGMTETVNNDVEYLIKEKIWEKDSKTTNTFDERFSIHDPFNFTD
tara:strand:- start:898 stop:1107 length:210 start_codon:yes stop_codon:yes gene_type:complete